MAEPYVLKDVGEITTIHKPGVVSGTTSAFFSKQEFTTLRTELAALQKKAPATLSALMQNKALTEADKAALQAVGIATDETSLAAARTVKAAADKLGTASPEVFLRGAEGRPVMPDSLATTTRELKEVMKKLTPEQTAELKELLSGGEKVIKSKALGDILSRAGLSQSGYMIGQDLQLMGPELVKSLKIEFETAARVGSEDIALGLTAGKNAVRGSATVSEMLGVAGIAATIYFTAKDVTEKAELAQKALADNRLSPQAYQEYKLNMTGQALAGFDPSGGVLGGSMARMSFEDFADKYHLDKRTRDELAPASMLFQNKSAEELKARYFFDRLPLKETPDMSPAMRNMVHMKQQIYQEAFDHARDNLNAGLLPDIRQRVQQQLNQDQTKLHLTQLQSDFMNTYDAELKKGTVDAWMKDPKNNMDAAYDSGLGRIRIDGIATAQAKKPSR